MTAISNYAQLEAFGRERLSSNFFMREFLQSEIAAWHGLRNELGGSWTAMTRPGMGNHEGSHEAEYAGLLASLQRARVCLRPAADGSVVGAMASDVERQHPDQVADSAL